MPSFADCCGLIRRSIYGAEAPTFEQLFVVGLRFLEASAKYGKSYIASSVLAWSARQWASIILVQSFRLRTPLRAVPEIQSALATLPTGRRGLAALLLAVLPYLPFRIEPHISYGLVQVAQEHDE